ncbi:MAG: HAD family phosphatase [Candidatus Magasanikbacteria bacterium]
MDKIKAVIFDMDGVMVDSEIHWPEVEKDIWPQFGIKFTPEFKQAIVGINRKDALAYVKQTYGVEIPMEDINVMYNAVGETVYKVKSNLMPGVRTLILACKNFGFDLAIASSSPLEWIEMVLEKFDLKSYFKTVCSTTSMNVPGKPDPAIYSITMRQLGLEPSSVIIVEDSVVGVKSGKASGARVIAVPDKRWSFGDFSQADLVVESLQDKKMYTFLGIS